MCEQSPLVSLGRRQIAEHHLLWKLGAIRISLGTRAKLYVGGLEHLEARVSEI
jgi:hypothetical protein